LEIWQLSLFSELQSEIINLKFPDLKGSPNYVE
jgi:hypothetical protein